MKKNNRGFTLVELMAVIIILGIIAVIAYPLVTGTISKSKKKLSTEQINVIYDAANMYAVKNGPDECGCVTIDNLQKSGYLEKGKVVDPATGGALSGAVRIKWDTENNQYDYHYDGGYTETSCGC